MVKRYALLWMVVGTLVLMAGCWKRGGDEEVTPAAQLVEASQERTLGANVCNIQLWAAESVNVVHGRDIAHSNRDRVMWNLAQARMAAIFEDNPNILKDEAIQRVAVELRQLYETPDLPGCSSAEAPKFDPKTPVDATPATSVWAPPALPGSQTPVPQDDEQVRVQALFTPQPETPATTVAPNQ